MTGFNLPPGCNVSDIPGNRPEDIKQELIEDEFFEHKLTKSEWSQIEKQYDIVCKAIWYGYEIGIKEQQQTEAENKFYDKDNFNRTKLPKLRKFFKEQRYKLDFIEWQLRRLQVED